MSREIGDKVRVNDHNDNPNYDSFRDKILIITRVAHNSDEHGGYDDVVNQALYDFETEDGTPVPCSLYEYEIEGA